VGRTKISPKFDIVLFGEGLSQRQLAHFTYQLATMLDVGLPILRSLETLAQQHRPGPTRQLIESLIDDIGRGLTFAEALARWPESFDGFYVKMIAAGETGGILVEILHRMAAMIEDHIRLRRRLIGIMIYPACVLGMAFLVGLLVSFMRGQSFPLGVLLLPILAAAGIWAFRRLKRTEPFRYKLDKFKLGLPLLGKSYLKIAVARFARTLGMLTQAGVPIIEALEVTRQTTGNEVVGSALAQVQEQVRKGYPLGDQLSRCGLFDAMVVDMVHVGEETGELDRTLFNVAENCEDDVDMHVGVMTSLLKPVLIIIMGIIVGLIVFWFYLTEQGPIRHAVEAFPRD
jgi:type IV pilus assembly protein PilC